MASGPSPIAWLPAELDGEPPNSPQLTARYPNEPAVRDFHDHYHQLASRAIVV